MKKNVKDFTNMNGDNNFSPYVADEVLLQALDSGVTELVMTKEEYKQMRMYLMGNYIATWDWDKESVWGIKFIIEDNGTDTETIGSNPKQEQI